MLTCQSIGINQGFECRWISTSRRDLSRCFSYAWHYTLCGQSLGIVDAVCGFAYHALEWPLVILSWGQQGHLKQCLPCHSACNTMTSDICSGQLFVCWANLSCANHFWWNSLMSPAEMLHSENPMTFPPEMCSPLASMANQVFIHLKIKYD